MLTSSSSPLRTRGPILKVLTSEASDGRLACARVTEMARSVILMSTREHHMVSGHDRCGPRTLSATREDSFEVRAVTK
jgi:hypothetical protein